MERRERLNEAFNFLKNKGIVHTQKDVAKKMGSTSPNVSSALKGVESVLTENFLRRFNEAFGEIFDEQWLLTGEGEMLRVESAPPPRGEDTVELPLIPISAMAGALSGDGRSFMEYDCEKYVVPAFEGADFLIRVQGDSMTPTYESGDIVACQRVPLDRLWFQWGKAYVIDTRQGALVKRIEPSEAEGCISIRSDNPRYKPFDLPTEEVNGVALVKGLIRVE